MPQRVLDLRGGAVPPKDKALIRLAKPRGELSQLVEHSFRLRTLVRDEARRIAANIAKLPELLTRTGKFKTHVVKSQRPGDAAHPTATCHTHRTYPGRRA